MTMWLCGFVAMWLCGYMAMWLLDALDALLRSENSRVLACLDRSIV